MLKSELLRIRSSRATCLIAIVVLAEAIVGGFGVAFLPDILEGLTRLNDILPNATDVDQLSPQTIDALRIEHRNVQATVADLSGGFGLGFSVAAIGAVVFGALCVTSSYRRGSIVLSALAQPSRRRLLATKATALTIAVAAMCIPLVLIKGTILAFATTVQDASTALGPAALAGLWLRGIASLILFGILGFGVGFIVRSSVAALTVIFAVVFLESSLRPISALVAGGTTPVNYLPFGLSADAVRGPGLFSGMAFETSIGTVAAGIALLLWTLGSLSLGAIRFAKDDIPVSS